MQLWYVLYPVAVYFFVANLVTFLLSIFWQNTAENYLLRHILAVLVSLPILYQFYHSQQEGKLRAVPLFTAVLAGAGAAVLLNRLIALTPLYTASASFQSIQEAFYGGTVLLEIVATCILTPVMEELLYRGIAYNRLRNWLGVKPAILWSAFLFGIMHLNLVQFVYAGLIGILLAWIMEHYGLGTAIAAHMGANLISVLRSEFAVFRIPLTGAAGAAAEIVLSAVICTGAVAVLYKQCTKIT